MVTPFTSLLLLLVAFIVAAVLAVHRQRMKRQARCPHCCVRRPYYVGYAHTGRASAAEPAPVRCKSCQLLFRLPR